MKLKSNYSKSHFNIRTFRLQKVGLFILIFSVGLLFFPYDSFAESNYCNSIVDTDGDNVPDVFPKDHLDYSYCDLKGIDLSKTNLENRDFRYANLSGVHFFWI